MRLNKNNAFTLSELLVAALILAFTLIGMLGVIMNIMHLNQLNRNTVKAASHSQSVMEEIKKVNFSTLQTNINNGVWDLSGNSLTQPPFNFTLMPNETVNTSVFQTGNPLGVNVEINWQESGQGTRAFSIQTFITNI